MSATSGSPSGPPGCGPPKKRFSWAFFTRRARSEPEARLSRWGEFPESVQVKILSFLDMHDLMSFSLVCTYAHVLGSSDALWRPFYDLRFPPRGSQADPRCGLRMSQKAMYAHRLRNPAPGDEVQCLWTGSFNLVFGETVTSYEGRAWWQAIVVRREGERSFLIHYPQWDSGMWDETVPRERLRWPPRTPDMMVRVIFVFVTRLRSDAVPRRLAVDR